MHLKSNNNSTARNTAHHIPLRHPPLKVLQSKSTWLSWFQLCFLFLPDSKRTYVEKYGFYRTDTLQVTQSRPHFLKSATTLLREREISLQVGSLAPVQ